MPIEPNRRQFLRAASAGVLAGPLTAIGASTATARNAADRKLLIVVFGGGTRSSEAIDDPQHRYVPQLWQRLVPRGTLLTNMRVEHRVVHPNSAASIVTGHWEWDHLDWSIPPAHPTVSELVRRGRDAPDTAAWVFAYASILSQTGHSTSADYGRRYAANVVTPPTIPRWAAEEMSRLMMEAAGRGSAEAELAAAKQCAKLARSASRIATGGLRSKAARRWLDEEYAAWRDGTGTTSHDAFLADRAVGCMRRFAPDVITVNFGEIDCAHYGSWSRYVEAIRRTDTLTWRLWQATQQLPGYRHRTLMLVLPDHGRELDRPGRPGFIHHSNFYTNEGADEGCRRVWMLAVGPGVAAGRRLDCPLPTTSAAATGLQYLDLPPSPGAARSVLDLLS
jgi:hypothetical protein